MSASVLRSAVVVVVTALGWFVASGVAKAAPVLQIVSGTGVPRTPPAASPLCPVDLSDPSHCEVTGDAGGTAYPWPNNSTPGGAGAGSPSADAGWPVGAGFGEDGSFFNHFGTSGWHASFLNLTLPSQVTFQYMGRGDASDQNEFQVFVNGNWTTLFDNRTTPPCQVSAISTTPVCVPGVNEFTVVLPSGPIPFRYLASIGTVNADTFVNFDPTNGAHDNPDTNNGLRGGYFLGIDPYLASGPFQNAGSAAYAALTDLPAPGDHDFQDLAARIVAVPAISPKPPINTVPVLGEGGFLLLVAGFIALAWLRLRKA